jgi:cellulose synthase (UDP-forming)
LYPGDAGFQFYWIWLVYFIEVFAFVDTAIFLILMSRHSDRSKDADDFNRDFIQSGIEYPTVDVFIPTYNEPIDVLERAIVGALAIDYPKNKLNLYVLDEMRRDWLAEFCKTKGAIHVVRLDNTHAKAGNMNNGLKKSRGELVAIFDADFVPFRNFLSRTVPMFLDSSIGIVQTPQHFFNKDPIQSNLSLEYVWPDEQRLFFDEIAPSRDAWNVSFCCGSCSILRRVALESIGGFPTDSITEDLLTTLTMLHKGYKTRYLNERLSMGLAAESLKGYFVQRDRWCQGAIQTLYLDNGPLRGPGLTLFQRIMFFPVPWIVQYFVRFVALIVPPVYLWTGISPLFDASAEDIIYFQFPYILSYILLMRWLTPNRYIPLISTAVGVFSTFRLLPTVIKSIIKPFGASFKVTPKGSVNKVSEFDWFNFMCIAILVSITASGLFINVVPDWSFVSDNGFSAVIIYWAAGNLLVLTIASLICFEKPHPPSQSFEIVEPAQFGTRRGPSGGVLLTLSMVGGTLRAQKGVPLELGEDMILRVDALPRIKVTICSILSEKGGTRHIEFSFNKLSGWRRDKLILKIYSGNYSPNIESLDYNAIASALFSRAFGR